MNAPAKAPSMTSLVDRELMRLGLADRLSMTRRRVAQLLRASIAASNWAKSQPEANSGTAALIDAHMPKVQELCDVVLSVIASGAETVAQLTTMQIALYSLATETTHIWLAAQSVRVRADEAAGRVLPGPDAKIVAALDNARTPIFGEAYWLQGVVAREAIAADPMAEATRMKRLRVRRALGFRAATVKYHETDILTLQQLGLLPRGENVVPDDVGEALEVLLGVITAAFGAKDLEHPARDADPFGMGRIPGLIERISQLMKASEEK